MQQINGPKFVQFFSPVIEALKELGGSGRPSEVRNVIARQLNISDQDRTELLKGGALRFDNQVAWARFYLVKAGLVDSSKHGVWSLSDKGREDGALSFDKALTIFRDVHAEFQTDKSSTVPESQKEEEVEEKIAPNDTAASDDSSHRKKLLEVLLGVSPSGFERLCQRLLRESGFEQVVVTGRSVMVELMGKASYRLIHLSVLRSCFNVSATRVQYRFHKFEIFEGR